MSYIDVISQSAATAAQSEANDAKKSTDIMGKEDFLTLLVAQLQNQDPLNPDEPTEFTAQLAQFSSLEQLFNLNESMENMASSVTNSQKLSALSMIGKEVAYADSKFTYQGDPVNVGYSIDGEATNVTLLLQKDGATVATLEGTDLQKGDHFITWNGTTPSGLPAPHGDYSIVVQATAAVDSIAAAPLVRSEVTGVDLENVNGGMLFTLSGEVEVNKIKGVYEAYSDSGNDAPEQQESENTVVEEVAAEAAQTAGAIAEDTVPTEG
ncbi:MAG: flagellar hook assembly protein FlgD [Desulfobulbia bacterium]